LTANGKLDRRALPEPQRDDDAASGFAPPRTDTEQQLAAVWSRVLARAPIGRDANFFELGGHSLLATRVASEVARTLGKALPVRALFEHSTLQALAGWLDAQQRHDYEAIPRASREQPLPLS